MKSTLKPLAVAAALVAGLAAVSMAATGSKDPLGPERVKERVARMKTDLSLTDAQATQIEQIMNDGAAKADAIRKAAPADPSAAQSQQTWEQLRQNHDQTREKVRGVLTEEQRARMDQLKKERRGRYGHKKDGAH